MVLQMFAEMNRQMRANHPELFARADRIKARPGRRRRAMPSWTAAQKRAAVWRLNKPKDER